MGQSGVRAGLHSCEPPEPLIVLLGSLICPPSLVPVLLPSPGFHSHSTLSPQPRDSWGAQTWRSWPCRESPWPTRALFSRCSLLPWEAVSDTRCVSCLVT